MLISMVNIVLWCIAAALLVPATAFCIQCIAALFPARRSQLRQANATRPSIAVLIPAHNEATTIAAAISSIVPQLQGQDRILVVADNCTDDTADVVRGLNVEVIERKDDMRRGKGFALDFGIKHLGTDAPEIVVVMDSDCIAGQTMLEAAPLGRSLLLRVRLKRSICSIRRRIPARKVAISALAFLVKNLVRPRGLARLGLPCLLTGSGMAFPWDAINQAALASDNIVEDMQLGIDLTLKNLAPRLCLDASITGRLPEQGESAHVQRRRWEHGHMQSAVRNIPRLVSAGIKNSRAAPLSVALDLAIPPLSLFIAIMAIATMLIFAVAAIVESPMDAPVAVAVGLVCVFGSVITAWVRFGRSTAPAGALLAAPYI